MEKEYAVVARNVSKSYSMYHSSLDRIKDVFRFSNRPEEFYALRNISFEVEKGDVVGLLGMNGSGKSTLGNIIAGICEPTKGSIEVNGETSIIAISTGLNSNLTGMENIEMKGLMIGLTMSEIEQLKESIIEFADIGKFIHQPVKKYSSGMKSRLGFAIAVNINPDILVIDEALSVGDATFTEKCLNKMNEFREQGKTIFFVSHAISQINEFCNKALWLEYGTLKAFGDVKEIAPMYNRFTKAFNKLSDKEKKEYKLKAMSIDA